MEAEKDVFPKWKYHKEKEARIFKSQEEFNAAGNGWVDSPAKLEEVKPEEKLPVKEKVEEVKPKVKKGK